MRVAALKLLRLRVLPSAKNSGAKEVLAGSRVASPAALQDLFSTIRGSKVFLVRERDLHTLSRATASLSALPGAAKEGHLLPSPPPARGVVEALFPRSEDDGISCKEAFQRVASPSQGGLPEFAEGDVSGEVGFSPTARALFEAVDQATSARVKELVELEESLINVRHPQHGGTVLHVAAEKDETTMVDLLLHLGADVNARSFNGATPLHWASGAGSLANVEILLRSGADVALRTWTWSKALGGRGSGQTAVHWAAESGHDSVVKKLAEESPEEVVGVDERQRTPREVASMSGSGQLAALTLEQLEGEKLVAVELSVEADAHRVLEK